MKYFTKSSERASECFLAPRYTRFTAFTSKKRIVDSPVFFGDNKQLLDEVERDIVNYQNRDLCYNTDTRF